MIRKFLSISVLFSTIFVGVCGAQTAEAKDLDIGHKIEHQAQISCDHCDSIDEGEYSCCDKHFDKVKSVIITKTNKHKTSEAKVVKHIQSPLHKLNFSIKNTWDLQPQANKAPPHCQISLPKRE